MVPFVSPPQSTSESNNESTPPGSYLNITSFTAPMAYLLVETGLLILKLLTADATSSKELSLLNNLLKYLGSWVFTVKRRRKDLFLESWGENAATGCCACSGIEAQRT